MSGNRLNSYKNEPLMSLSKKEGLKSNTLESTDQTNHYLGLSAGTRSPEPQIRQDLLIILCPQTPRKHPDVHNPSLLAGTRSPDLSNDINHASQLAREVRNLATELLASLSLAPSFVPTCRTQSCTTNSARTLKPEMAFKGFKMGSKGSCT